MEWKNGDLQNNDQYWTFPSLCRQKKNVEANKWACAAFIGTQVRIRARAFLRLTQTCTRYWNEVHKHTYSLPPQNVTKHVTRYSDSKNKYANINLKVPHYFLITSNATFF